MDKMNLEQYYLDFFLKDLEELNISLSEKQLIQFMSYYELLIEWNQVMNLTAITDFDEVMKKHFIDSLSLVKAYDVSKTVSLIDIGTGAGFPGIPLKIAFPDLDVTLLDSLNKRVNFLNTVIDQLGLEKIQAIHGRAEDFAKKGKLREQYDICVSRAVANLSTLSEYCLPYVKIGGYFITMKANVENEEVNITNYYSKLNIKEVTREVFNLPKEDSIRTIIKYQKLKETDSKYPRRYSEIIKRDI